MAERRRLLVAIVVRGAPAREIDGLRRALRSPDVARIAPHVTLVPPRNIAAAETETLEAHLRAVAARFSPLQLAIGPPARFTTPGSVLYLAVGADPNDLPALAEALASGPLASPTGREERPFVAHVTLRSGLEPAAALSAEQLLGGYRRLITIDALTLLEQQSGVEGHPWAEVGELRLGRPQLTGRGGRELEFHLSSHLPADLRGGELASKEQIAPLVAFATEVGVTVAHARAVSHDRRLFVVFFEVLEGARRFGIGSQLLGYLERVAREQGQREIVMLDSRAPEFLESHGYRPAAFGAYVRELER